MSKEVVYVYEDAAGEWRWSKINTGNHQKVGASEEGYVEKSYCIKRAGEENPGLEVIVDDEATGEN